MKRLLLIPALLLAACTTDAPAPSDEQPAVAEAPVEGDELVAEMGTIVGEDPGDGPVVFADDIVSDAATYDGTPVRVAGVISEVCQNAGCWLTFQNEAGTPFRVTVPRDDDGYVFTFPMDISGQNVVVAGTLALEETDVETLRHLAEDGGASEAELAAITEPERTLVLSATGARLEGGVSGT